MINPALIQSNLISSTSSFFAKSSPATKIEPATVCLECKDVVETSERQYELQQLQQQHHQSSDEDASDEDDGDDLASSYRDRRLRLTKSLVLS